MGFHFQVSVRLVQPIMCKPNWWQKKVHTASKVWDLSATRLFLNELGSVGLTYLQFLAQHQRWAANRKIKVMRVSINQAVTQGQDVKYERVTSQNKEIKGRYCRRHVGIWTLFLPTSKVTRPSGWLSAAMSKYTVGFLFAVAGPLLHSRAAVNAREHIFILFDRNNMLFQKNLWLRWCTRISSLQMSRLRDNSGSVCCETGSTAPKLEKWQLFSRCCWWCFFYWMVKIYEIYSKFKGGKRAIVQMFFFSIHREIKRDFDYSPQGLCC